MPNPPSLQVFTLDFTPETDVPLMCVGRWQIRATARGVHRIVLPTRQSEAYREDPWLVGLGSRAMTPARRQDSTFSDSDACEKAQVHLNDAAQQITEYLNGARRQFTVPLDPARVTSFQRRVHHAIADIPYADTWSYGRLAAAMGEPKAVRAVGTACGVNPLPLIVPCHRVVRADGSLGHYTGGVEFKRALLVVEGCSVESGR